MNIRRTAIAVLWMSLGVAACGDSSAVTRPRPSPVTTVAGTSTSTSGPIRSAAKATATWNALHASSYSFHYAAACFCPRVVGVVTVTSGVVTGWNADPASSGDDRNDDSLPPKFLPTIDELLSDSARAEREATGKVEITYDPETGVPIHAFIDWIKNAIDDEFGWTVRDLTVTAG